MKPTFPARPETLGRSTGDRANYAAAKDVPPKAP